MSKKKVFDAVLLVLSALLTVATAANEKDSSEEHGRRTEQAA